MKKYILLFSLSMTLMNFMLYAQDIYFESDTVNQTDANGLKQGYWAKVYPSGRLAYEAFFVDNKPVGTLKRYATNGSLKAILHHVEGTDIAKARMLYRNGVTQAEGNYVKQEKDSVWNFYSSRGQLRSKVPFKNNMKNGTEIIYYIDGNIAREVDWKNDALHGAWKQYHLNGKISVEMYYENDIREGKYMIYSESGRITLIGLYGRNFRQGKWTYFDDKGNEIVTVKYIDGIAENQEELERLEQEELDRLENNRGKFEIPTEDNIFR